MRIYCLAVQADRDVVLVNELGLHLKYALNTHVHADHVSGSFNVAERNVVALWSCLLVLPGTGALKRRFPDLKSLISARYNTMAEPSTIFVSSFFVPALAARPMSCLVTISSLCLENARSRHAQLP